MVVIVPPAAHAPKITCVFGTPETPEKYTGCHNLNAESQVPDLCAALPQIINTPGVKTDQVRWLN